MNVDKIFQYLKDLNSSKISVLSYASVSEQSSSNITIDVSGIIVKDCHSLQSELVSYFDFEEYSDSKLWVTNKSIRFIN